MQDGNGKVNLSEEDMNVIYYALQERSKENA